MTIKSIAERAGVSVGTVSNVLNKRRRVREEKVKRVLEAAKLEGYRPRARKERRVPLIAVCGASGSAPEDAPETVLRPGFNEEVAWALVRAAEYADVDLLFLTGTRVKERRSSADYYLGQSFDALIAYHIYNEDDRRALGAVGKERPTVVLFADTFAETVSSVSADNNRIGRIAARELISRGYRRFVHVAGGTDAADAVARCGGFKDEMSSQVEQGKAVDVIEPEDDESSWREGYARRAGERIRALQKKGDSIGVFTWCDPLGIRLINWARDTGELDVGGSVGVIGCDNLAVMQALLDQVGLSSISLDCAEIARLGIQVAKDLMTGTKPGKTFVIEQEPRVATRSSTMRA